MLFCVGYDDVSHSGVWDGNECRDRMTRDAGEEGSTEEGTCACIIIPVRVGNVQKHIVLVSQMINCLFSSEFLVILIIVILGCRSRKQASTSFIVSHNYHLPLFFGETLCEPSISPLHNFQATYLCKDRCGNIVLYRHKSAMCICSMFRSKYLRREGC